ncbi:MAG TPA: glycosyltransferase [Thermoproteales archaeon]|nr:glycosyltransferase [Thermoproteales archaeon]
MKVSVIIPVKNGEKFIERLLESLLEQEVKPDEIIVVDDGSQDGTVEIVEKYPVKLLHTEGNRGANRGRNIGLSKASGDIIALIDADCIAPKDWLKNIKHELETGKYACIGGSVLPFPEIKDKFLAQYANEAFFPIMPVYQKERVINRDNVVKSRLPNSNNMAFLREAALKAGMYFDEDIRGGAEEHGFLWRLIEKGYTVKISPKLYIYHNHRTRLRDLLKQLYNYGKGLFLFFKKYPRSPVAYPPSLVIISYYTMLVFFAFLAVFGYTFPLFSFLVLTIPLPLSLLMAYYAWRKLPLIKCIAYPFLDMLTKLVYSIGFLVAAFKTFTLLIVTKIFPVRK